MKMIVLDKPNKNYNKSLFRRFHSQAPNGEIIIIVSVILCQSKISVT